MKNERPVNLDIKTIWMPVTAIASITHRICAVIIWVAMAIFLPAIYVSLDSAEGFNRMTALLAENFFVQFIVWGFLTAMSYYAMGSLKHIIQEMGHFETIEGGRFISNLAIGLGVFLSLLCGIWVWG